MENKMGKKLIIKTMYYRRDSGCSGDTDMTRKRWKQTVASHISFSLVEKDHQHT
jgi:hypothetical protein